MLPNAMQVQVNEYYVGQGIHPQDFRCAHQAFCRRYAFQGVMTPVKMSMVGSIRCPLSAHCGGLVRSAEWGGDQRTTAFISNTHEAEDYTTF